MMIIYGAMYKLMSWDGDDGVISLHKTREGAEYAIKKHKEAVEVEGEIMAWEKWLVTEYELLD